MRNVAATKIVSTLGPASNSEDMIRKLYRAGVTMFRLNSSHGDMETHKQTLDFIRKIEKEEHTVIPVLLDLQGPKIRVGKFDEPIEIKAGEVLKFRHQDKGIADDVKPGDKILIDDGKIQLTVEKSENNIVYAKVLTSGVIKPRKGLNLPGGTASLNILTERDKQFVEFAMHNDIDYLGLSFVRCKEDLQLLRGILDRNNSHLRIISKIEKPQALENIDDIIEYSDGIMVARGDLGIETPIEQLPIVQKTIIRKTNAVRKPVIVATQMLESMIENPMPTRAEASDVANAIIDGADAVMLSGETAAGKYPVEAVSIMKKIAEDINNSQFMRKNEFPATIRTEENAIPMSIAVSVADTLKNLPKAKGVIALTATGYTTALISECRPSVPIYSFCEDAKVGRFMQLFNSVSSIKVDDKNIEIDKSSLIELNEFLKKELEMEVGDCLIITGSVPHLMSGQSTNFMKIHKIS